MSTTNAAKVVVQFEADVARYQQNLQQINVGNASYVRGAKNATAANDSLNNSFRTAAQGIASVGSPLSGVTNRVSGLNSLLSSSAGLWAGLGVAVGGVTATLAAAVREAANADRQLARTEALLTATGGAAGLTAEQLDRQAVALSRNTLASLDSVQRAQQVLIGFRSVSGPIFTDTIRLSQDLASVMGTDIVSATRQLAQALSDPERGLNALASSGIAFNAVEREKIATMFKAGQEAEAQREILERLERQIGGTGAAEGAGVIGAVDGLKQSWSDLLIALERSTGAGNIAESMVNRLDDALQGVARRLNPSDNVRWFELRHAIMQLDKQIEELDARETRRAGAQAMRLRNQRRGLADELAEIQGRIDQEQQRRADRREQAAEAASQRQQERESAVQAEKERQAAELQKRQEERDRQQEERRIERERAETERAVAAQASRFDRIHELALQADNRLVDLAQFRNQREREQLEAELEFLRERNALTEELEQQFRQAREEQELVHQQRITDIKEREERERIDKEAEGYRNLLTLAETYNNARIGGINRYAAVAIQVGRTLLNQEKREALTKAKLDGRVAMQKAVASAPPPANIPAITWAGIQTAANISAIAGIAHGGLERVPKESTYLLDRGERVLSPRQNKDLTDYLEGGGSQKGVVVNVHNYGNSEVDVRRNGSEVDVIVGQVVQRISDDVSRGRGFANVLQDTYQSLNRRGVS